MTSKWFGRAPLRLDSNMNISGKLAPPWCSNIRIYSIYRVGYLVSSPSPWLEKAFTVGAPLFIRLLASSSSMHTAEILKEADEQLGENFFLGQLEEGDRPAYNLNHGKPGEPHAGAKRFFLKARRPETQATYDFATTSVISGVPHYLLGDRVRDNQEI